MTEHALADELLARAGDRFRGTPAAALAARLVELVGEAQAAWPGVPLPDEAFVRHLAAHLAAEGEGLDLLAGVRAADLYLACACREGLAPALAAFERRYLLPARAYLGRVSGGRGLDDLLQELREKLFVGAPGQPPRIGAYAGRGSLEGWLRVVAVRLAIDTGEKTRHDRDAVAEDTLDAHRFGAADPELGYIKSRHRADFAAAFREALATLTAEERSLLRLYLLDELNIAAIGSLLGVHRATVARRIAACRARILEETRTRLRTRLHLSDSETDSVIALAQSQLDVSLQRFLRTPA